MPLDRFAVLALLPLSVALGEERLQFNRDVRPILSDNCFTCHGPDAATKKIPLRLDQEQAAKADLGGRKAIVPGKPDESEVMRRVTADKPARRMPPAYTGHTLSAKEIDTLRTWIAQGAEWEKHWSFIAPRRAALPAVRQKEWVRNPIDLFVVARLEKEGLAPSPEASRETLIRRVSLDLTGIPPSPKEIDAFLTDRSPDAYEKLVDRLLASPRFGERMAARWLDAARYADTNGYQFDGERVMWRWRDWVIDSFNRNQRFDQFTLEQIAGDLLPNATVEQKIATGFNRNHRANTEDGIIPEEYAVEYVVDRVEAVSTVFLGLTLGCTRCHNHKYDPFTQKEFYQLFAYFDNVPELGRAMKYGNSPPLIPAPTREQQAGLEALLGKIRDADQNLAAARAEIGAAQSAWEKQLTGTGLYGTPSSGLNAAFSFDDGKAEGKFGRAAEFDGHSVIEDPKAAQYDIDQTFSLAAWVYADGKPNGAILTRMADTPTGKGFGIYAQQGKIHVHITNNYADDAIRMESEEVLSPGRWHHVAVTYTGSKMAEGIRLYVDGRVVSTKVLQDTLYRPFRNAGAVFTQPLRIGGGGGPERRFKGRIDEVRIYNRVLSGSEVEAIAYAEPLQSIAAKPAGSRTVVERELLRSYFLEHAAPAAIRTAYGHRVALERERETFERSFPTVMIMAERPVRKETHLLLRGAYDKPGEKVEPGVPAILPPLPAGAPNNRLALAQWLIDPANPLPARVAVNRFWQMNFGIGLVKTSEDFGTQGEWPSHPELLDWLATEFVRTGWDVKAMQKLIVTSATYRQSSKASADLIQRDPENRLLARGPRNRMPAEMIRDQALAASGLLHEKLGGPSVKPYQPAGLWKELAMQDMDYVQSKGSDLYRRSLYTFWKRTIAPPMMVNFDAANHESCVVRENRTNTPLQALNLMNDVTFLEAGRFVGQRMWKEGGHDAESRLRYGFRLVTGRFPSRQELTVLRGSLQYHLDYFSTDAKRLEVLRYGDSPADASIPPRELAAYAAVGNLLLNLDEAVTKE